MNLAQQIEYAARSLAMNRRSSHGASAMAANAEAAREAIYVAIIRAGRPCTCSEISRFAAVSREGAHEHLKVLLARGDVINISDKRGAIYAVKELRSARLHQADPTWLDDLGSEE